MVLQSASFEDAVALFEFESVSDDPAVNKSATANNSKQSKQAHKYTRCKLSIMMHVGAPVRLGEHHAD